MLPFTEFIISKMTVSSIIIMFTNYIIMCLCSLNSVASYACTYENVIMIIWLPMVNILLSTSQSIQVTLFHDHYLAWPDHGVPANATSMVNFIKRGRNTHPYSKMEILQVHCCAGVRRTSSHSTP